MQQLRQFNEMLLKLAGGLVIITMAAIAIIIPCEVFGRYIVGKMLVWSNEFSQYALVWASMMGGAVGLKRGYQVGITTLTDNLPPGKARWVKTAGYAIVLVFFAFMTFYGISQTWTNRNQTSSTLGIPMSYPYAALPVGFLVMFFVTAEQLLDCLFADSPERKG